MTRERTEFRREGESPRRGPAAPAAATPGGPGRILAVLLIGVFMGALDIAIVGPALKPIQSAFGVDERQLAWVFTIYVLFNLIGNPLMAKLSDLYGRRPVYMMDIGLFALGSVVVAAAPSFAVLLAGRAVQGFAAGGIFPVASATIGETFPPERRGRALGLTGAMFGLAFLLGPVVGGLLLHLGWQWLFLINLPLAALVLVLSSRVLPAARRAPEAGFDWAGMVLLAAGLVSLALGLNRIDSQHFAASLGSPRVWPLFALALVALVLFVRVERRVGEPVIRPELLRNRQLGLANALSWLSGLIQSGLVFVPSLAAAAFGVGPSTASFLLGPAVLASTIGAPVTGRLLDRAGSRVVIAGGTVLLGLGLLLVPAVTSSLLWFVADGVLIGFGLASLTGAPLRYVVLNEATPDSRAAAQSLLTVASNIGQMAGGAVIGAIIASHGGAVAGYEQAFLALGVLALAGFALSLGLKDREGERRAALKTA
ncbi:MAG: MFS transporter [Bacillota bacterium]|nr:MAG: MFS transporter [Bacillota bacterium]